MKKYLKSIFLLCTLVAPLAMSSCAQKTENNQQPETEVKTEEVKTMKAESGVFLFENDVQWEPAGENIVRQIMGYNDDVMLVKVKFEKVGAVGTPHAHPHTQTTYVASGRFEFTVGDETKIVSAGDGLYMEPDVLHGCVCIEPGILIDCFAPMRADFLKK